MPETAREFLPIRGGFLPIKIMRNWIKISFAEGLFIFGLVTAMAWSAWELAPKPKESNPAYVESMAYSQKSEAHRFATEYLWRCNSMGISKFTRAGHCVTSAIGQATIERDGAFGQAVKEAIIDTNKHMDAWSAEQARQGL